MAGSKFSAFPVAAAWRDGVSLWESVAAACAALVADVVDVAAWGTVRQVAWHRPSGDVGRWEDHAELLSLRVREERGQQDPPRALAAIAVGDRVEWGYVRDAVCEEVWATLVPAQRLVAPAVQGAPSPWIEALNRSRAIEEARRARGAARGATAGEADLEPNDLVHHPRFGACRVVRADDDHVVLRRPTGKLLTLGRSVLSFSPAGTDGRHRVWDVTVVRS